MSGPVNWRLFLLQECLRLDAGQLEDGARRAVEHIAGMVGDGGVAVGGRVLNSVNEWMERSSSSSYLSFASREYSCIP